MPTRDSERLTSLHKYFLNASAMRRGYETRVREDGFAASPQREEWTTQWIYLSLWYATLYVTIEGWLELGYTSSDIATFTTEDAKLAALKRFRNGVFHYQNRYFDERFTDFIALGAESAAWARALHDGLGRDLLGRMADPL